MEDPGHGTDKAWLKPAASQGANGEGFSFEGVHNPKASPGTPSIPSTSPSSQTPLWGTAALSPWVTTCGFGALSAWHAGGADVDSARCATAPAGVHLKNLEVLSSTCKGSKAAVNRRHPGGRTIRCIPTPNTALARNPGKSLPGPFKSQASAFACLSLTLCSHCSINETVPTSTARIPWKRGSR